MESIENKAFYECTSLTSITIPGTIVSIQDKTFEGCDALESLYYEGDIAGWCEFKGLEYLNKDKNFSVKNVNNIITKKNKISFIIFIIFVLLVIY